MLALLVIKVLFHVGNFGWGFYVVLASALVLVYGAFETSRERLGRPRRMSPPTAADRQLRAGPAGSRRLRPARLTAPGQPGAGSGRAG